MRRILLGLGLLINACGTDGPGPAIPSAISALPSADGAAQPTPTPTPVDETAENSDTRFTTLPSSIKLNALACEEKQRFFDLSNQTCTRTQLASFPCQVDEAFKSLILPSTIKPLEDYIVEKVPDMILYACTELENDLLLHFYKYEEALVSYRKVSVAKK